MITKQDLQQTRLFDKFNMVLSPKIREKLDKRWEGIFREVILELMPVDEMGKRFCPNNGRPTQELYAMCGLILMKNFFGWNIDETLMKYSCDLSVQYALNVQQEFCELGRSTFMRYLKDFQSKELAGELFEKITQRIISKLNINLELQRLDSTHVCSNMASWGRNQLMFNIIKRFLIQLKRHESKLYHNLNKELINRYNSDGNWIFASPNSQDNSKRVHISSNRERLAWDMLKLLESFEKHPKISNMNTFKNLHRVFSEQCEMIDNKVVVKKHPGGDIMINPSDPDATCGHKGDGYQVQVMETYSKDNDVQIVTTVLPQKANASDPKSVTTVVELAKEQDVAPQKILADAGYGADENVETLKESNIDLNP